MFCFYTENELVRAPTPPGSAVGLGSTPTLARPSTSASSLLESASKERGSGLNPQLNSSISCQSPKPPIVFNFNPQRGTSTPVQTSKSVGSEKQEFAVNDFFYMILNVQLLTVQCHRTGNLNSIYRGEPPKVGEEYLFKSL